MCSYFLIVIFKYNYILCRFQKIFKKKIFRFYHLWCKELFWECGMRYGAYICIYNRWRRGVYELRIGQFPVLTTHTVIWTVARMVGAVVYTVYIRTAHLGYPLEGGSKKKKIGGLYTPGYFNPLNILF